MRFRLLTYNIHKGIGGLDRRYDLARIVETIAHYQPDVALLQEVDDGAPRSLLHCQCEMLAEALALPHRSYQRNVRLKIGHYGNALLSRFPLADVGRPRPHDPLQKAPRRAHRPLPRHRRRAHAHRGHRQRAPGPGWV